MASIAERVPCFHCHAKAGTPCQKASGGPARTTHVLRWNALNSRMHHQRYIVSVKADNDRLGVKAGEEYLAQTYWLDPSKVTLLARIPDGRDPQCNQYRSDVEWLRWDDDPAPVADPSGDPNGDNQ